MRGQYLFRMWFTCRAFLSHALPVQQSQREALTCPRLPRFAAERALHVRASEKAARSDTSTLRGVGRFRRSENSGTHHSAMMVTNFAGTSPPQR